MKKDTITCLGQIATVVSVLRAKLYWFFFYVIIRIAFF